MIFYVHTKFIDVISKIQALTLQLRVSEPVGRQPDVNHRQPAS